MKREDIIRMALEAGLDATDDTLCCYEGFEAQFVKFAQLVAVAEREECHKLAINAAKKAGTLGRQIEALDIATAIRARK